METVGELMSGAPVTVDALAPLAACAHAMHAHHVRHLPMVDPEGRLAGVVWDFELFRHGGMIWSHEERWVPFEADDAALCAQDVAVVPQLMVEADAPLLPVLRSLAASADDVVVVVDAHRHPVGVLTEHDGVRLAGELLPSALTTDHEATRPVVTVDRDREARHALELMYANGIRHVVVVDDRVACGVVSFRDLVRLDADRRPGLTAGAAVGRTRLETLSASSSLRDAAHTMVREHIGCFPVVDDEGRPVRVLTRSDLIGALVLAVEQGRLSHAT